jgi:hypothetical protein
MQQTYFKKYCRGHTHTHTQIHKHMYVCMHMYIDARKINDFFLHLRYREFSLSLVQEDGVNIPNTTAGE